MSQTVWIRPIALVAAILFLVSWVFPVAAGLAKDTSAFPKWWGPVDVGFSLLLAIVAIEIQVLVRGTVNQRAEDKDIIYRVYRTATHGIMVVGILVIVAGDRIAWGRCATGLMWRTWLGLYILPCWLTALSPRDLTHA